MPLLSVADATQACSHPPAVDKGWVCCLSAGSDSTVLRDVSAVACLWPGAKSQDGCILGA